MLLHISRFIQGYFTILFTFSLALIAISKSVSDGFVFLFNIFAIPTIPIVSIFAPLLEKSLGMDNSVLLSVAISCAIYFIILKILISKVIIEGRR